MSDLWDFLLFLCFFALELCLLLGFTSDFLVTASTTDFVILFEVEDKRSCSSVVVVVVVVVAGILDSLFFISSLGAVLVVVVVTVSSRAFVVDSSAFERSLFAKLVTDSVGISAATS